MSEQDRPDVAMQCLDFRRATGADPGLASAEIEAHAAACASCAEYRRQMRSLDGLLHRALDVPVPVSGSHRSAVRRTGSRSSSRWLALAASVLIAAGIGFGLWSAAPRESLATTVVEHLQHEPDAMQVTGDLVAPFALNDVLARSGIRLRENLDGVSYARSCPIRGHWVPHLVVQSEAGPVTVLVMAHEHVRQPVPLHEAGLTGTIVPAGPGSIAIIGTQPAPVDEVRNRILAAVEFVRADQ